MATISAGKKKLAGHGTLSQKNTFHTCHINSIFILIFAAQSDKQYHMLYPAEKDCIFLHEGMFPDRPRPINAHKGTVGHLLVVAGSKGMAGASLLAAHAALRSGCGMVSVHGPACNRIILQTALPETMFLSDKADNFISCVSDSAKYTTLVIGPGIGTNEQTGQMLSDLLPRLQHPCVLDADALNLIASHKTWLGLLPPGTILTPHPKEFERLFGTTENPDERIHLLRERSTAHKLVILLKGAGTLVAVPSGRLYKNTTGNPGMATAGSGDVLAGIIGGLLAQGYSPEEAAAKGVFIHGKAGDMVLKYKKQEALIASDIIKQLNIRES